jgi:hypothetical protein
LFLRLTASQVIVQRLLVLLRQPPQSGGAQLHSHSYVV